MAKGSKKRQRAADEDIADVQEHEETSPAVKKSKLDSTGKAEAKKKEKKEEVTKSESMEVDQEGKVNQTNGNVTKESSAAGDDKSGKKKKRNKKNKKSDSANTEQAQQEQQDGNQQDDTPENKDQQQQQQQQQQQLKKKTRFIVFVGNLPFTATADSVRAHFAALHPISVRLLTQRDDPSKSRGIAFVEFGRFDHMKTCLDKMHHSIFNDGKSPARKINVELTYVYPSCIGEVGRVCVQEERLTR